MDLNKHVVAPAQSADTFHSNGIAQTAGGDSIGAASKETFMQRRQIDGGRRVVGNYRFSNMGRSFATLKATPIMPESQASVPIVPKMPENK